MTEKHKFQTGPDTRPPYKWADGPRHHWEREYPDGPEQQGGWRAYHSRRQTKADYIPDGTAYEVQHRDFYRMIKNFGREEWHAMPVNAQMAMTPPEGFARKERFRNATELWDAVHVNYFDVDYVVLGQEHILPFIGDRRAREEFHYSYDPHARGMCDYGEMMGCVQVWIEIPNRNPDNSPFDGGCFVFWKEGK